MTTARWLAPLLLLLGICGCGPSAPPVAGATASTATSTVAPGDPKLARLYAQTCKACHANPGSGAPLAGDRAAWAPRLAQGEKTLLDHAINGYKGMPPMGSCSDCGEAEFSALIKFMSGGS